MGKRANKRQKTLNSASRELEALGTSNVVSLLDDANMDDEERRLESILFGKKFVPAAANENLLVVSDDEEEEGVGGGTEFQAVLDTDLFFVDDVAGQEALEANLGIGGGEGEEETQAEDEDEDEKGTDNESTNPNGEESGDEDASANPPVVPTTLADPSRKGPAWVDPDDANLNVSLASNKRLKKLRDALAEDDVGGKEYERKLRRQFEKVNPPPDWANKARAKLGGKQKRRRSSQSSDEESSLGDEFSELITSSGGVLGPRPKTLRQTTLAIERLRDANLSAPSEGAVKTVQFHPSAQVPVMLTASEDRRLRLYNVDGHTNPHLQTVHIPDLPIASAIFHPAGTSVLLTGPRPFYHTYDLQSGVTQRSPRGLWGTTFNGNEMKDGSMEICAFDPSGEILAVAGRRGYVHLVDWRAGSGQVVGSVKMNSGVKGLWWTRGSGRSELMSLGEDAQVYVWDVGEKRCVRKWTDDGGYGSHIIGGDRSGQYLGVGSRHGVVNVYGTDALSSSSSGIPKPLKSISNLTTSISSLRFNSDSQLLALASNTKKDQMRMVHLPSLTVFSNWPTSGTPLGHVTSIDFSAGSEYLAVGNSRGRVSLYQLLDFAPRS